MISIKSWFIFIYTSESRSTTRNQCFFSWRSSPSVWDKRCWQVTFFLKQLVPWGLVTPLFHPFPRVARFPASLRKDHDSVAQDLVSAAFPSLDTLLYSYPDINSLYLAKKYFLSPHNLTHMSRPAAKAERKRDWYKWWCVMRWTNIEYDGLYFWLLYYRILWR